LSTKNIEQSTPLVSVCLPLFNGEAFLQDALISLKNQTYSHLELIVSDDNSIDASRRIVEEFALTLPFPVRIFNHIPNGIGANWNNCIRYAKGEFVKFLFQDDLLEPQCIEQMVKQMLNNPSVGLVYCKRKIIVNKHNEFTRLFISDYSILHTTWSSLNILNGIAIQGKKMLKDEFLLNTPENKIGEPSAVLIKTEVFKHVGFFSNHLVQCLDVEFWLRLMSKYDTLFLDQEFVSFRLHMNQASQQECNRNSTERQNLELAVYQNVFPFLSKKLKIYLFFKFHPLGKLGVKCLSLFRS